jgi:hypothetical protein
LRFRESKRVRKGVKRKEIVASNEWPVAKEPQVERKSRF